MLRFFLVASVTTLAAATPLASAAPFAGHFEQTGTAYLSGVTDLEGPVWAVDLVFAPGGRLTVQADEVHRLEASTDEVFVHLPALRPISAEHGGAPAVRDLDHRGAVDIVFPDAPFAALRFIPDGSGMAASLVGESRIEPPGSWAGFPPEAAMAHVQAFGGIDLHPDTPGALLRSRGDLSISLGPGYLVVDGPVVDFAGQRMMTGYRPEDNGTMVDPVTGSGRHVATAVLAMVTVSQLKVDCADCEAIAHWGSLAGSSQGTVRWHGVEGVNGIDGTALPRDVELLESSGQYRWDVKPTPGAMEWNVRGEASWVKTDADAFWAASVTVGAGLAIAATALLVLGSFKGFITFLLGRHTPRLAKASLLDGSTRYRILKAIHESQPATLGMLGQATGLSRGSLRYQLRILESHGVLQAVLPSGHQRRERCFMLNSGSLMFKAVGLTFAEGTPDGQEASGRILSAVTTDPVRAAVLDLLLARGAMTFEQLHAALLATRVVASWPRSTASYHLTKLVASKAIGEKRVGLVKMYFAEIDPVRAKSRQYSNYFIQSGNQPLAKALADGPKTHDELVSILDREGHAVPRLKERLGRLTGLALLQKDDSGRYAMADGLPMAEAAR